MFKTRTEWNPRKVREERLPLFARVSLAICALAYLLGGAELMPAMFYAYGVAFDSQHEFRVAVNDDGVCVKLAHTDREPGACGERSTARHHQHGKPARLLVGSGTPGHPDHVANFAGSGTGDVYSKTDPDVSASVKDAPLEVWHSMVRAAAADVSIDGIRRNFDPPPAICGASRPVVLLI